VHITDSPETCTTSPVQICRGWNANEIQITHGKLHKVSSLVQGKKSLKHTQLRQILRTFASIATAHRFCARKFTSHVMHRARNKISNDREDGHRYSLAWVQRSRTFADPYFSFQKQIIFTMINTLSKNEQKLSV